MKLTREVESSRKCPFCMTVNSANREKCRNCGHSYPFPLKKDKLPSNRQFHLNITDPRNSTQKTMEVAIRIVPGLLVLAIPLLEDRFKIDEAYYSIVGAAVILIIILIVFYLKKSNVNVEKICSNCGQVMVLRIPFSKNKFPSAVKCWNCGAVHEIQWIDSSDSNRVITAGK